MLSMAYCTVLHYVCKYVSMYAIISPWECIMSYARLAGLRSSAQSALSTLVMLVVECLSACALGTATHTSCCSTNAWLKLAFCTAQLLGHVQYVHPGPVKYVYHGLSNSPATYRGITEHLFCQPMQWGCSHMHSHKLMQHVCLPKLTIYIKNKKSVHQKKKKKKNYFWDGDITKFVYLGL